MHGLLQMDWELQFIGMTKKKPDFLSYLVTGNLAFFFRIGTFKKMIKPVLENDQILL
jgi:hypothetical protein